MLKHLNAAFMLASAVAFHAATAKTIRVPSNFPSINAALVGADYGDTVAVSPGRYYENGTLVQGVVLTGTGAR
jgi:hypothetical protein